MKLYRISLPKEFISISDAQECSLNDMIIVDHFSIESVSLNYTNGNIYHLNKYGINFSRGEIANFLTHKLVWEYFLKTDEPFCLVVEDNVKVDFMLEQIIKSISELPDDWDVFVPYDLDNDLNKFPRDGFIINYPESELFMKSKSNFLWKTAGNSIYAISRTGATKMQGIENAKQRLDDEFIDLAYREILSLYYSNVEWFNVENIVHYRWLDKIKVIWNEIQNKTEWKSYRIFRARYLLSKISDIGQARNLYFFLCYGSLLGFVRHNGIMKWDDDIDIAISDEDLPILFDELSKIDGLCYSKHIERITKTEYYKVWLSDGEPISGFEYTFPFIDIWPFSYKKKDILLHYGDEWKNSLVIKPKKVLFEGSHFYIPYNYSNVLDLSYSNWKNLIVGYPYCHLRENCSFRPFLLSIECDASGRIKNI